MALTETDPRGKLPGDRLHVGQREKALVSVFELLDPAVPEAYPPGLCICLSQFELGFIACNQIVLASVSQPFVVVFYYQPSKMTF